MAIKDGIITFEGKKYRLDKANRLGAEAARLTTEIPMNEFTNFKKELDWQTMHVSSESLTATTVVYTDAHCDAVAGAAKPGIGISSSALHLNEWDSGAICNVQLPTATAGEYFVYRNIGQADQANAIHFQCANVTGSSGLGDAFVDDQVIQPGRGIIGALSVVGDTSMSITPAATNCGWGHKGSEAHFLCKEQGKWLVKLKRRNLGTGANSTGAFSKDTA